MIHYQMSIQYNCLSFCYYIFKKGFIWHSSHRKDGTYCQKTGSFEYYAINGSEVSFLRIISANGCKADGDII